ncbi:transcriptional regulator LldR [Mixta intestinalis]|uniref:L-lactate dehydrogenase operon regulatory protein n=1 Tax=Mixta intestinalis TaxID=1615494 RepID=A0A6P1Q3I7_9GAMM|nr:transcriptional regulator LldR [Mixta intestinalis]QHM73193.1 Putative L-lactate dehydrogenase operon regulatory protein [Mixta intestinalis]
MGEERRLADILAERLRHFITEQRLRPGERLPAERQLAQQLAVSRSSLREALQKLISEGVLISRRGGGNFIAEQSAGWSEASLVMPLSTLLADDPGYRYDVLEARITIESSTAWHAARRATAEDKAHITRCYQATLQISDRDDPDLAAHADVRFHLAIAEAAHNLVLLQAMRGLFDLLQSSVMQSRQRMYTAPEIFRQLAIQHQAICQAIVEGDAERARSATIHHLEFVDATMRRLHEEEARRARSMRIPDSKI